MPTTVHPPVARAGLVLGALLAMLAIASPAAAALPFGGSAAPPSAAPPEIPADATPEQVDALLATVTDAQARALLARELKERAQRDRAARRTAHGGFGVALVTLRKRLEGFAERVRAHAATLREGFAAVPVAVPEALRRIGGEAGLAPKLRDLVVLLLAGLAAQALARRRVAAWRDSLESAAAGGAWARLSGAALRLVAESVPVAVFSVLTLGAAVALYGPGAEAQDFVVAYLAGATVVLGAYAVSRTVLSPHAPALRLVPLGEEAARFLHRWTVALVAAGTLVWLTAGLVILSGVPMPVHLALVVTSGGLLALLAVPMILSGRRVVAEAIESGAGPGLPVGGAPMRRWLAARWHWIALAYVAAVYLAWSYNMLSRSPTAVWAGIGSVVLVLALPLLDRGAAALARALFEVQAAEDRVGEIAADDRGPEGGGAAGEDAPQGTEVWSVSGDRREAEGAAERRRRYAAVAHRGARLVIGAFATVILLQLWGVNVVGVAGPEAEAAFWTSMLEVAITLLVAYLLWELTKALIDPHLPRADQPMSLGDEDHVSPRTRAETLLPLLRTTVLVLLVLFTVMICLANLGVDIGPLLAGAGVVGLAIGFGAQALVKDIVSGIFFLVDDAFRVGEYIEFGDLRGEVEAISLRSLKLRHHRGAVHTVPFGELRSVTNYNRDWVIYKMEFRLPMDTDVEKVRKLVKKIGQELLEDPEVGDKFLQPLKSQGIHRVEENAIILRTKFMCKPREQFMIRRQAYRLIKERFAENGIRFAPRTVRVAGEGGAPDEAAGATVAAIAADRGRAGAAGPDR